MVPVAGAVPSGYAAEPDPATSWAGSRAGEGRERPGRPDAVLADPAEEDAYAASLEPAGEPEGPEATAAPEPSQNAAPPGPSYAARPGTGTTGEPVLQALALGVGLMLMGLGLGLAFVGLRIRRD